MPVDRNCCPYCHIPNLDGLCCPGCEDACEMALTPFTEVEDA
jgi:hypothetical protein